MQTSDGSVDVRYEYDLAGNVTRIVDTGTAMPKDATYEYYSANRLTKATIVSGGETTVTDYRYSPSGNLIYNSDKGNLEYGDPRHPYAVTKVGEVVYAYDLNGNLSKKQIGAESATYTYDYANRLAEITNFNGTTQYIYGNTGDRIQKRLPGGERTSYFGKETEVNEQGKATNHIFAEDRRMTTLDPEEGILHTVQDHLGSVNIIFKDIPGSTKIIQKLDYFPFGTERINEKFGTFSSRYTFTGKERDTESGLQYFGARYYDPEVGRFMSIDPMVLAIGDQGILKNSGLELQAYLAEPQNLNGYAYAKNNPLRYIDPNGENSIEVTIQTAITAIKSGIKSISAWFTSSSNKQPTMYSSLQPFQSKAPISSSALTKTTTWDPVTDKRIRALDPRVRQPATNFINNTESQLGIQLRITSGYRPIEEQDKLYEVGRTNPGEIITYARGGESYHNYGLGMDVVRMNSGIPDWTPISPEIAAIAKQEGFEWGGDWGDRADFPHFQMTFGKTWQQLKGSR